MKNKKKTIYIVFPLLIVITFILFHPNNVGTKMDPEINNKIKIISHENIYFGHRSVGENIIAGLNKLISENGRHAVIIKDFKNSSQIESNYFMHSNIGQNGDPKSKFEEFSRIVNDLVSKNLDVAMMKLCFVDITKNTNLDEVFGSYVKMIDSLQNKYPNLTIIHFSVPLKTKPSLLVKIKNMIKGRDDYDLQDEVARNKYNELLYLKYSKDKIFDLAEIESTYPNGKREFVNVEGKPCYILIKDYTDDGGHLNTVGQQVVSEKLINKLFEIIKLKNA